LKTLTPLELFVGFSKIGLSGFGGVLPWARRTIVEQEKWLTAEEFNAMLGICQLVPGPNIVNLGVCIGGKFAGVAGAFASVLGLLLGPIALLILIAILYEQYSYMPIIQGMLKGVSAIGVGLIASTGIKMLRSELKYPPMLAVIALVILSATYFKLGLGWVVLLSSPLAILLAWKKAKQ
jgi:chromate transporter